MKRRIEKKREEKRREEKRRKEKKRKEKKRKEKKREKKKRKEWKEEGKGREGTGRLKKMKAGRFLLSFVSSLPNIIFPLILSFVLPFTSISSTLVLHIFPFSLSSSIIFFLFFPFISLSLVSLPPPFLPIFCIVLLPFILTAFNHQ